MFLSYLKIKQNAGLRSKVQHLENIQNGLLILKYLQKTMDCTKVSKEDKHKTMLFSIVQSAAELNPASFSLAMYLCN